MSAKTKTPRVFISYSWTPEEHKEKTIEIANRLRAEGIDVVIDVWDLHAGNDTYAYMEQMVSDDTIDYVLLMCSKTYASKVDNREGGAGVEGAIVSQEVYNKTKQTKFIPVILEADDSGKAYKPIYLKPTFHIDLSSDDSFESELEMLIRHIYNKPLYEKPPLGSPPPYILDENLILTCHGKLQRFKKDVYDYNQICRKTLRDFSQSFFSDLSKMIAKKEHVGTFSTQEVHDYIKKMIEHSAVFTPLLEELAELFAYGFELITEDGVTGFLEDFLNFTTKTESDLYLTGPNDPVYMDVPLLPMYEFFLLLITYLLNARKYAIIKVIVDKTYTIKKYYSYRDNYEYVTSLAFNMFNHSLTVFQSTAEWKNNYRKCYSDLIKSRLRRTNIEDLVETDFLLSIMSYCRIKLQPRYFRYWNSYICGSLPNPVNLFNKMKSSSEFARIAPLFCASDAQDMHALLEDYNIKYLVQQNMYCSFSSYHFCELP